MAGPFSSLFKTFISSSSLPSETKLGMALRIAQINGSPYTVARVERLLGAAERGKVVLGAMRAGQTDKLTAQEQQALAYADALTKNVAGLSDGEFQAASAVFNDSQIVEMSFTVSFFNYFTRFAEALNLPVEAWVFETAPAPLPAAAAAPARVWLVSDEEIRAVDSVVAASKAPNSVSASWNIGIANSQRATLQRAGHAGGVEGVRRGRTGIHVGQPRDQTAGLLCGFHVERMPLLYAAPGAGAAPGLG